MADFEKAISITLKHEGGFVNHPADPGGATNKGITFNLFKQYADALGVSKTLHSLQLLSDDQAKFIYRENFWEPMKGDHFKDQNVANIVFDAYVNSGRVALKQFQKELGVSIDGHIGPNTLSVLNNSSGRVVFEGFKDARIRFYNSISDRKPEMRVFLKGWLNRINSFEYNNAA